MSHLHLSSRRAFLGAAAIGLGAGAFFTVPGLYAQELARTPRMTEGPFYPSRLPLDTDNDLIIINNSITPAVGEITNLTGRVLSASGEPVNNATVEIWQCDARSVYIAQGSRGADANFQGFGRFTTAASGEYRFRTIKPVAYPGRTPHIHFKVKRGDRTLLTSQIFIAGEPANARDGIFRGAGGVLERELVCAEWRRNPESRLVEYRVRFNIVLGVTPDERPDSPKQKKGS